MVIKIKIVIATHFEEKMRREGNLRQEEGQQRARQNSERKKEIRPVWDLDATEGNI